MMFAAYRRSTPDVFQRWVEGSDVIILESGMSPIFLEMIHKLNPNARKIYIASDLLDTIGVDPFVSEELNAHIDLFDTVVLPSRLMAPAFPPRAKLRFVPHGLEVDDSAAAASPYEGGINAVSVGSMLFDREFFDIAAPLFPHVTFHVIGGGRAAESLKHANVKIYGEMPYEQTLAYIKHAQFRHRALHAGARARLSVRHLDEADAIRVLRHCRGVSERGGGRAIPAASATCRATSASIENAVRAALKAGKVKIPPMLSWAQVTDRILSPQDFADTGHGARGELPRQAARWRREERPPHEADHGMAQSPLTAIAAQSPSPPQSPPRPRPQAASSPAARRLGDGVDRAGDRELRDHAVPSPAPGITGKPVAMGAHHQHRKDKRIGRKPERRRRHHAVARRQQHDRRQVDDRRRDIAPQRGAGLTFAQPQGVGDQRKAIEAQRQKRAARTASENRAQPPRCR